MKTQISMLIAILLAPINYAMGEEPPESISFVPAMCNGIISFNKYSGGFVLIKPSFSAMTISNNNVCMENMSLDIYNSEGGEFHVQGDKVVLILYNVFSTSFNALLTKNRTPTFSNNYPPMEFFPGNVFSFNGELKTASELAALGKLCAGKTNKGLQQSVPGYAAQGASSPEP